MPKKIVFEIIIYRLPRIDMCLYESLNQTSRFCKISQYNKISQGSIIREYFAIANLSYVGCKNIPRNAHLCIANNQRDVLMTIDTLKCVISHTSVRALEFSEKYKIMTDVAQTLAAAHAIGLYHNDIKSENIMLDENNNGVLIDWGNSSWKGGVPLLVKHTTTKTVAAPCKGSKNQYVGLEGDIWSFGVTMISFMCGFDLHCIWHYFQKHKKGKGYHRYLSNLWRHVHIQLTDRQYDQISFLFACVSPHPRDRGTSSDILKALDVTHLNGTQPYNIFTKKPSNWYVVLLTHLNKHQHLTVQDIILFVNTIGWYHHDYSVAYVSRVVLTLKEIVLILPELYNTTIQTFVQ